MTDPVIDPLVILLSRLSRDVLLSEERDQLRDHVDGLVARVAELEQQRALLQAGAIERSALLEEARDALESAGINEAHGGESWPRLVPAIEELAAENARLTAGQCTHHVGICDLHHTTPVTGCLYPRCATKQQTEEATL